MGTHPSKISVKAKWGVPVEGGNGVDGWPFQALVDRGSKGSMEGGLVCKMPASRRLAAAAGLGHGLWRALKLTLTLMVMSMAMLTLE